MAACAAEESDSANSQLSREWIHSEQGLAGLRLYVRLLPTPPARAARRRTGNPTQLAGLHGSGGFITELLQAKFLSQDQINEYKECFSLYDKQQRGRMKACDLLVAMRCLGASPTPGEVQRHLQTHGIDSSGELDFSTFLTVMHTQIKQEDPKKEILLAMLMADKEKKGYIMASELRSKLTRLGEKLTHKEGDAWGPSPSSWGGLGTDVGGTPQKTWHLALGRTKAWSLQKAEVAADVHSLHHSGSSKSSSEGGSRASAGRAEDEPLGTKPPRGAFAASSPAASASEQDGARRFWVHIRRPEHTGTRVPMSWLTEALRVDRGIQTCRVLLEHVSVEDELGQRLLRVGARVTFFKGEKGESHKVALQAESPPAPAPLAGPCRKPVDDLFREAQVDADGRVQYDDFIDRVTLPVQEY
ncbi:Calmodulin-like protein 4 [Tupaia chinensis]|uniref:Calmodulin-like protein 4 n=1 Tax=Tupaia chinensis TaxID=246437 RepID=L9KIP6_TUPCH|nr:Calmodulin-like protein 4 [Tupaia chinensis]